MIKMWVTPTTITHEVAEKRNYQKRIAWPLEEAARSCGILAKRKRDDDAEPIFHLYRLSDKKPLKLTAREANILHSKLSAAFSYRDDEVKVLQISGRYSWAKRSMLRPVTNDHAGRPVKSKPSGKRARKEAPGEGSRATVLTFPLNGDEETTLHIGDANERRTALIAMKYHARLTERRIVNAEKRLRRQRKLENNQQKLISDVEKMG